MSLPLLQTRQSLIASKYLINTTPTLAGISTNTINISSSNIIINGNVGIGTSIPLESLHVQGNVYIPYTLTINSNLELQVSSNNPTSTTNYVITNDGLNTPALYISQPINSNAYLSTFSFGSSNLLIIKNNGNVGIGTNNALQELHVVGQSYFSSNIGIGTTNSLHLLRVQGQSCFLNNVGIGTTIPLQQLHVVGQSYFFNIMINANIPLQKLHVEGQSYFSSNVGIGTTIPLQLLHVEGKSSLSSNVGISTTNPLQPLHVQGQSYFSSNLGIGTTIPLQTLHIQGQSYFTSNVGIGTTNPLQTLHVQGQSYFSTNAGIGTTNPLKPLHVQGQSYFSSNVGIGITNPLQLLHVVGKSYFSSNIGIGTTNPSSQLHLYTSNLNISTFNSNCINIISSVLKPIDTTGNYSNVQITYPPNMLFANSITNPIMYSSLSPDNTNGSIYFSGNQGNYITFASGGSADSNFLNLVTSNYYAIEGWVNYQSIPNVRIPNLIGRMSPTSNALDWSFGMTSNQKLTFAYYTSNLLNIVESTTTIPLNQWNFINMTYNGSNNSISLFINGNINVSVNKKTIPNYTSNYQLTIGQQNNVPVNAYISNFQTRSFLDTQQIAKLTGSDYIGEPSQGQSVALSSDGNTLAVGGIYDNNNIGAVWIFTRSGNIWTQQGTKLVGTGYSWTEIRQGCSVALSADGNTLAVGGFLDNYYIGATWIFSRSGSTWTQQGTKLVGTGYTGTNIQQGWSIALSSDGNTLAVGGFSDNNYIGATWIFTRSGTTWTQQGDKLIGIGYTFESNQGYSVSLSADGNTLAIGGLGDNGGIGATWIFTRSGTTWTQQGDKLVGTGYTGSIINQGQSVTLSADRNTLAVCGYGDNINKAATWIFTRSGTIWTQQGDKLVGTGYIGSQIFQGQSSALSSDGNKLAVGIYLDSGGKGAVWIFTRSGTTWTQQATKLVGTGYTGQPNQGTSIALSSDGNTLAVGGPSDNTNIGASWIFNLIYSSNFNYTNVGLNVASSNISGFSLTNNGLIGIGTSQPQAMIHLIGNNQLVPNTMATPILNVVSQNGSTLWVDAGGTIGIGTTNPQQYFQVQSQAYFASNVIIGNKTISSNILTVGGNITQNTGYLDAFEGVTAYRSSIPHSIPSSNINTSNVNTTKFLSWLQRTTTLGKTSWWSNSNIPLYSSNNLTISGTTQYYTDGGVLIPDGRVVFTPSGATNVGVFNPNTNTFTTYSGPPGSAAYSGSVLVPDGRVIFVPYTATTVGVFNPFTNTFSTPVTGGTWGNSAYSGGVLVPDGRVIFVPLSATTIGIFNPSTNTYSTISPTPALPANFSYNGGVLLPDGRVIFVPAGSSTIGIFNPINNTYSTIVLPTQKIGQYAGGVLLTDGRVLFVPGTGTTIGFFNYITNTFSTFTPTTPALPGTIFAQFDGGVLLPNGNVLFIPSNSTSIWIFNPTNNTYNVITPSNPGLPIGLSIFSGGILLPDGRVVMIPASQSSMGILSGFTRPPYELCYHPSFNKY